MIILNKFDVVSDFSFLRRVCWQSVNDGNDWDSETIRGDWSRQRWFNDRFAAPFALVISGKIVENRWSNFRN